MPSSELMQYEADLAIDYDKSNRSIKIITNGSESLNKSTLVYLIGLTHAFEDVTISTCEDLNNFMGVVRHLRSRFV